MAPNGSGWSEGPLWLYLNGNRATDPDQFEHPPLNMRFNSADISGDGTVNLTDIALFATDFYGQYHYRSDFYWDGNLNLSDLGLLASSMGVECE